MAHIQDRWWRVKTDPVTGKPVLTRSGNPAREKTERFGTGERYKVRWLDPDNQEQSKSFPDKHLDQARDFKTKIENDLRGGTYQAPDAGKIYVTDYSANYQKGRSQDPSSKITVASLFKNQINAFMGHKYLESITVDVLRDWLEWMNRPGGGISLTYQAEAWRNLSAMLDAAVDDDKIRSNPCHSKAISPPKARPKLIRPWSMTKLAKVHEGLANRSKVCIQLGAGLGLRQGEILAFSPDDIDRDNMVYHCNRQVHYKDGRLTFRLPKGHKTRLIPLGEGVLEAVDLAAGAFPPCRVTLPWSERDGKRTETANLLLTNDKDWAWIGSMFNSGQWQPAFAAVGLKFIPGGEDGMHQLRHLYASHMLAQGVSIKELAEYLGHSSEGFTLKTYVHLMPSSHRRARLAANLLFPPTLAAAA